jgi:hypothetical protein
MLKLRQLRSRTRHTTIPRHTVASRAPAPIARLLALFARDLLTFFTAKHPCDPSDNNNVASRELLGPT